MSKILLVLCAALQILQLSVANRNGECGAVNGSRNALKLTIDRQFNVSDGQWTTTFSAARTDSTDSTSDVKLEATHGTVECGRHRVIRVEMMVKDVSASPSTRGVVSKDGIVFHHRHARNVVVFNGGLSAQRIDLQDQVNSAAFTNRPLKDNEMFTVRMDKKYADNKGYCQGIGVMEHSPDEVQFLDTLFKSEGVWMLLNVNIYSGGKVVVPNYYKASTCNMEVNDTIGVMKRDNGSLHFFVNGVDQGPSIKNAPSVLYGVYEVRGMAAKATIVS